MDIGETKFERNSRNDNTFTPAMIKELEKHGTRKFVKTSKKRDKVFGVDYDDVLSLNKDAYDFKHCHGCFIASLCTDGTININHPNRPTSESTHIVQGCFEMRYANWWKYPIKKWRVYTRMEYHLQFFKTWEDYLEVVDKISKYLFKNQDVLEGKSLFDFFSEIVTPHLKEGVEAFNSEGNLIVADSKIHAAYLKMLNKNKI